MTCKDTPNFMFPMLADIYYSLIEQSEYGQPQKKWIYDRTIVCNLTPLASKRTEEVVPNAYVTLQGILSGMSKEDIRTSSNNAQYATTNILITNIRDESDNPIYTESSGPRSGRPTIYEISAFEPFFGPFKTKDHYNLSVRRTENQAVTD